MYLRSCIGVCVLSVLFIVGCSKKRDESVQNNPPVDNPQKLESQGADGADDVFAEFYNDSGSTKRMATVKDASVAASVKKEAAAGRNRGSSAPFGKKGNYCVQVAAVNSRGAAQDMTSQLESKGYHAYIEEVQDPTPELRGTFYRVRIGGFDSMEKAKEFSDQSLTRDGYAYWITAASGANTRVRADEPSSSIPVRERKRSASKTASPSYGNTPAPATPAPILETPQQSTDPLQQSGSSSALQQPNDEAIRSQQSTMLPESTDWNIDTTNW